jgi:hypothetical protein
MKDNRALDRKPSTGVARLAGGGALAAALAYAMTIACCLPIALGATGAVLATASVLLGRFQPYLAGGALLLIVFALIRAHRPPKECPRLEGCPPPSRRRPLGLWLIAVVVVILLTMPYWVTRLL